jgi:hypothetical protein
MNVNWLTKAVALCLICIISACGLFRKSTKHTVEPSLTHYAKKLADSILEADKFDYNWFSAKCKIRVSDKNGSSEFTASVRAKKDSSIWISVSPLLGIEMARVLLTVDSVFVLDRLNSRITRYGYQVMRQYTNIPITFYTIQDLVSGNALFYDAQKSEAIRQDTSLVLTSSDERVQSSLYLNRHYQIIKMKIESLKENYTMNVLQNNYTKEGNKPFSQARTIQIKSIEDVTIELQFTKITLNEALKFPFPGK